MFKDKIITNHYDKNYDNLVKWTSKKFDGNTYLAEEAVQETYVKVFTSFSYDIAKNTFDKWFMSHLFKSINDLQVKEKARGYT